MTFNRSSIATGLTLAALGVLAAVAISAGGETAETNAPAAAPTPEVRTETIRRTVRVRRDAPSAASSQRILTSPRTAAAAPAAAPAAASSHGGDHGRSDHDRGGDADERDDDRSTDDDSDERSGHGVSDDGSDDDSGGDDDGGDDD